METTQGKSSTVNVAEDYEHREVSQYTANDERRASEFGTVTVQVQQSRRMLETINALQSLQKICETEQWRQRRNSVGQQFAELGTALSVHEQQWTAATLSLQYETLIAETLEFVKSDEMKMASLKKQKTKCEVWPPKELLHWDKIFTTHKDLESLMQADGAVRPSNSSGSKDVSRDFSYGICCPM